MYYEVAKWLLVAGLIVTGVGVTGTWSNKTRRAGRPTASAGLLLVLISLFCQLI